MVQNPEHNDINNESRKQDKLKCDITSAKLDKQQRVIRCSERVCIAYMVSAYAKSFYVSIQIQWYQQCQIVKINTGS